MVAQSSECAGLGKRRYHQAAQGVHKVSQSSQGHQSRMKISAGIRAFFLPTFSLIKRRFQSVRYTIMLILAGMLFGQNLWLIFHTAIHPMIKIINLVALLVVWGFWVFAP